MADLRDLYQQTIVDHNRSPRNFRVLAGANRVAEGYNPLCGDRISLQVKLADDVIEDVAFQGSGCAIARASASLMTTAVKGRSVADARVLFDAFHDMVTSPADGEPDTRSLGKLAAFAGVRAFPARVKCASLAWHTLRAALEGRDAPVSTESAAE